MLDWLLEQSGDSPWQALAGTLRRWQGWLQQRLPHDALDAIYRDGDLLAALKRERLKDCFGVVIDFQSFLHTKFGLHLIS